MTLYMLPISLFFLLILPPLLFSFNVDRLPLPPRATGPEALAFDSSGAGPYTGVYDGRILKYVNSSVGFVDFAVTSPNRTKQLCDGSTNPAREPTCGRPLGLGFNNRTGVLYIAEPYFGLVAVDRIGGYARTVAISAGGVPFRFLNGLDIDQQTGSVYFLDSSTRFQRNQYNQALLSGDRTGRLMKYNPISREVTVLERNLGLPVGAAISKDGRFVVYTEALFSRAQRFWLTGPKANTSEIFATFPGRPDNIKRNAKGEFWVAINTVAGSLGLRLSEDGKVLQTLSLSVGISILQYSEVQEYRGKIYLGSLSTNINYVGVVNN